MPTLREKTCKDEGRGWSDAATSKEHLVLLGNPQKLGQRQVLPHGLGRNQPCQPDPDLGRLASTTMIQ